MTLFKFPVVATCAFVLLSACQTTLDPAGLAGLSGTPREEPRDVFHLVRGHVKSGHWDKKKLNQHASCHSGSFWRKSKGGSIETVEELREYYEINGWNYEENYWPPILEELLTTGDLDDFKERKSAYCFYKRAYS